MVKDASTERRKPTKVSAQLMVDTIRAVIESGVEKEFIAYCTEHKFFLTGGKRSMKVASDFLGSYEYQDSGKARPIASDGQVMSARGAGDRSTTLLGRVCSNPRCDH